MKVVCQSCNGRRSEFIEPCPICAPIPMVLHCPACGLQHVDAPEALADYVERRQNLKDKRPAWTNPPHRSHLCGGCGYTWRPADVPTNGVASVTTKGKNDSAPLPAGVTWLERFKESCRAELANADETAARLETLRRSAVEACHTCGFLAGAHLDGCPVLSINRGAS